MIFLDASAVMYLASEQGGEAINSLEQRNQELACSEVVRLEVLGFPGLSTSDKRQLQRFLMACRLMPVDEAIINRAITLRQAQTMQSIDAIVAATALEHDGELWTTNGRDFSQIAGLRWYDPLAHS